LANAVLGNIVESPSSCYHTTSATAITPNRVQISELTSMRTRF
jgi:hypothetical protein